MNPALPPFAYSHQMRKPGPPRWVWGIIAGYVGCLGAIILGGIALYLFYPQLFHSGELPPPQVTFAHPSEEVPLTLNWNMLYIPVRINGKLAHFVLDSGAPGEFITPEAAKRLGVDTTSLATAQYHGLSKNKKLESPLIRIRRMEIGGVTLGNAYAIMASLPIPSSFKVDGIVGYDLLQNAVVAINIRKHRLTLYDPDRFPPPAGYTMLPIRLYKNQPTITGSIGGASGRFMLDTGDAAQVITISTLFAKKNRLPDRYPYQIEGSSNGIEGPHPGSSMRAGHLQIGDLTIKDVVVELPQAQEGLFSDPDVDGSLGNTLLNRFTTIFDYPHSRLFLAKNDLFDRPFFGPPRLRMSASSVTLPFTTRDNYIYVTGKLNGVPARFLVDTNFRSDCITPALARRAGLTHTRPADGTTGLIPDTQTGGSGGSVSFCSPLDRLELGGLLLRDGVAWVYPLTDALGHPLDADGILGAELFSGMTIRLDWRRHEITFYDPARFVPPANAKSVPLRLVHTIPTIQGRIGAVPGSFPIDTTYGGAMLLTPSFEKQFQASAHSSSQSVLTTEDGLRYPIALQKASPQTGEDTNCRIGNEFLSRFIVTFDSPHHRLYLEDSPPGGAAH